MEEYVSLVTSLRQSFKTGTTLNINYRKQQLKCLHKLCIENGPDIIQAVKKDLNKSKMEAYLAELFVVTHNIEKALNNLENWTKPEAPSKDLVNLLDKVLIRNEPYGLVLIIGSWNYPFQLCLLPLVGAIAAGNVAIVKPSEISEHSSRLLAHLFPKYMDQNCYKIIEGGHNETSALLEERFDFIFYTGSSTVGRIIHKAANKYLTPVVLELGGKCPVYLDDNVDMKVAARRILWGKLINAGQTCIAPDYLMCSKKIAYKFIDAAKKVLKEFYVDARKSSDYGRIINKNHFNRLCKLLDEHKNKIAVGGQINENEKFIAPTIIRDVVESDFIMQEEIFGPILPMLFVNSYTQAIDIINKREKPLALYVFSENKNIVEAFMQQTSSGGVTVNDTVMHFLVDSLPFGGVGNSGMGVYHGKYTFDTFSHKKSTLVKDLGWLGEKLSIIRYPPYSDFKLKTLIYILRLKKWSIFKYMPYLVAFFAGYSFFMAKQKYLKQ